MALRYWRSDCSAIWVTRSASWSMCCVIASSTSWRRMVGGMASTSTEPPPKPRARVSVCLVGRVGRPSARNLQRGDGQALEPDGREVLARGEHAGGLPAVVLGGVVVWLGDVAQVRFRVRRGEPGPPVAVLLHQEPADRRPERAPGVDAAGVVVAELVNPVSFPRSAASMMDCATDQANDSEL